MIRQFEVGERDVILVISFNPVTNKENLVLIAARISVEAASAGIFEFSLDR